MVSIQCWRLWERTGIRIDQDVRACGDNSRFQVDTYVFDGYEIVYSAGTWDGGICLEASAVDSAKKTERVKAEQFIQLYKSINEHGEIGDKIEGITHFPTPQPIPYGRINCVKPHPMKYARLIHGMEPRDYKRYKHLLKIDL